MIYNISFGFNPETKEVFNVEVSEEKERGITITKAPEPKKPSKPRKSKDKNEDVIKLEDNKLVLTQKLIDLIDAEPGDRILVSFMETQGKYYPVISKSEVFADPDSGNKLTKSLTISYRGKQREQLVIYGEEFAFKETHEGSHVCILDGGKDIIPDTAVLKSNKDKMSFSEDDNKSNEEDTSQFTYTRELKTSSEVTPEDEEDFTFLEDEVDFEELLNAENIKNYI